MRKIVVGAQVSMDGIVHVPGGPTEDPTKGFKFVGWAMPWKVFLGTRPQVTADDHLIVSFIH